MGRGAGRSLTQVELKIAFFAPNLNLNIYLHTPNVGFGSFENFISKVCGCHGKYLS